MRRKINQTKTQSPLLGDDFMYKENGGLRIRHFLYFNFSSTTFDSCFKASVIFPLGKLPCARLGRPPPLAPIPVSKSPALIPRLTTSSVTTAINVEPVVRTATPFFGYFSRNLSASILKVSTVESATSNPKTLTSFT